MGGSPGRVLKHPPALSMPLVWVQKAAQKNPAERKGLCEGLSLPVLPSPRSYFGAAAAGVALWWGSKGQRWPFQSQGHTPRGITTNLGSQESHSLAEQTLTKAILCHLNLV